MLSAVLCGCNETGTFSEKKYTPVYVYLSNTPYVGESSMSDFVDYPSDLVRLGLRGTVKEVKTTSAAEMVQQFNAVSGVLCRNHIHILQCLYDSGRHISQIADGCCT